MTEKELNRLYFLNKEIETQRKRLHQLQNMSMVKSHVITGLPRDNEIKNIVAKYAVEIADLESEINLNIQKCWNEIRKLERFINDITDCEIRQIIRLRHINGMTWDEIGFEMKMDRRTVSRKYHKYLKVAHNAHSICDIIQV